jgi:hypothetical protein
LALVWLLLMMLLECAVLADFSHSHVLMHVFNHVGACCRAQSILCNVDTGKGVPSGVNSTKLFHACDWLPTFAALAGVNIPSSVKQHVLDGYDIWHVRSSPLSHRTKHCAPATQRCLAHVLVWFPWKPNNSILVRFSFFSFSHHIFV